MNETINLSLTVEEVNAVLGNLGTLPYQNVFGLIEKIRAQGIPQLEEINKAAAEAEAAEKANTVEDSSTEASKE